MPYKFRRISEKKRRHILKCFAEDISATQASRIVGINRNTAGVSRKTFLLHLKECEFRYNNKGDILRFLKKITKNLLV